jgi:hypothetical protein
MSLQKQRLLPADTTHENCIPDFIKYTGMAKAVKSAHINKLTQEAPVKKKAPLKYSDKSAGQPALLYVFEELKKLMLPYVKGTIELQGGIGGQVSLISKKPAELNGKKKSEILFAAALIQKGYVGFYFMPIYVQPEIKEVLKPELMKCLKGKSCFYIKQVDKEIFSQIKDALKAGYKKYTEKGWV